MRRTATLCVFGWFLHLGLAGWAAAQAPAAVEERGARTPEAKSDEKCDAATTKEESSVTEHSIRVGGQTLSYKATASTTRVSTTADRAPQRCGCTWARSGLAACTR